MKISGGKYVGGGGGGGGREPPEPEEPEDPPPPQAASDNAANIKAARDKARMGIPFCWLLAVPKLYGSYAAGSIAVRAQMEVLR